MGEEEAFAYSTENCQIGNYYLPLQIYSSRLGEHYSRGFRIPPWYKECDVRVFSGPRRDGWRTYPKRGAPAAYAVRTRIQ